MVLAITKLGTGKVAASSLAAIEKRCGSAGATKNTPAIFLGFIRAALTLIKHPKLCATSHNLSAGQKSMVCCKRCVHVSN